MDKDKLRKLIPDFAKKLAPVYKALSWTWWFKKTHDYHIPSASDIAKTLLGLLKDFKGEGSISSGGLSVSYDKEDNVLSMEFTEGEYVHFDE